MFYRLHGLKRGKRLRSDDESTPCKLVKLDENKEPVQVDPSSQFLRRMKRDSKLEKKRNSKHESKDKEASNEVHGKDPSQFEIEKVTEITQPAKEELGLTGRESVVSVISESEKERIQNEVMSSGSFLNNHPPASIPIIVSNIRKDHRQISKGLIKGNHVRREEPVQRINFYKSQPFQPISTARIPTYEKQESKPVSREAPVSPIKRFAGAIKARINKTNFANSALFGDAFLVGTVAVALLLLLVIFLTSIPAQNYTIPPKSFVPHMELGPDGLHRCVSNSTRTIRL